VNIPNSYEEQIMELRRVLNINSGLEVGLKHPITKTLIQIEKFHNEREFEMRDMLHGKIFLLLKHLLEIEEFDVALLEKFRNKLKKVTDNEYFGERLEINVARSLIEKKIPFTKSERPDFIKINDKDIKIECTSSHLEVKLTSEKGILNKIRRTVNKKANESYANEKTALVVDFTNLYYNSLDIGSDLFHRLEEIRKYFINRIEKTSFRK